MEPGETFTQYSILSIRHLCVVECCFEKVLCKATTNEQITLRAYILKTLPPMTIIKYKKWAWCKLIKYMYLCNITAATTTENVSMFLPITSL